MPPPDRAKTEREVGSPDRGNGDGQPGQTARSCPIPQSTRTTQSLRFRNVTSPRLRDPWGSARELALKRSGITPALAD
jgi:hypothetical protein